MSGRERVEKTVQFDETRQRFHEELSSNVWEEYPRIDGSNPDLLKGYLEREVPFCSFEPTTGHKGLLKTVLTKALQSAADPNDEAFCGHGARKHQSFERAINQLVEDIQSGECTVDRHVGTEDMSERYLPSARYLVSSKVHLGEVGVQEQAVAVLLDLVSVAHGRADEGWDWRTKSRHIAKKYGPYSTSRVLSAFIKKVKREE